MGRKKVTNPRIKITLTLAPETIARLEKLPGENYSRIIDAAVMKISVPKSVIIPKAEQ